MDYFLWTASQYHRFRFGIEGPLDLLLLKIINIQILSQIRVGFNFAIGEIGKEYRPHGIHVDVHRPFGGISFHHSALDPGDIRNGRILLHQSIADVRCKLFLHHGSLSGCFVFHHRIHFAQIGLGFRPLGIIEKTVSPLMDNCKKERYPRMNW